MFRSTLRLRAISKYKPQGAYIRTGDLTEGLFALRVWGLIFGGAYFRNFTVYPVDSVIQRFNNWGQVATICFGTLSEAVSAASITAVYSYFEKGCRRKCARDNPER